MLAEHLMNDYPHYSVTSAPVTLTKPSAQVIGVLEASTVTAIVAN